MSIDRMGICEIVQARVAEILTMVREKIEPKGYLPHLGAGIVLTGGGALMPGVVELAQEIFGTAARIGQPGNLGGIGSVYQTPEFATVIGLVLHGAETGATATSAPVDKGTGGVFQGIRRWLRNFFE